MYDYQIILVFEKRTSLALPLFSCLNLQPLPPANRCGCSLSSIRKLGERPHPQHTPYAPSAPHLVKALGVAPRPRESKSLALLLCYALLMPTIRRHLVLAELPIIESVAIYVLGILEVVRIVLAFPIVLLCLN